MSRSRAVVKKIIYSVFGERLYQRAYVRGKIRDIKSGTNLESEASCLKFFIQPNSTVLDIGANYGHYTVEMARLANQGRVYAFEPVPFTFGVLERVVRHFHLPLVSLIHAAVSDHAGTVEMNVPLLNFGAPDTGVAHIGTTGSVRARQVKVSTVKIDDLAIEGKVDFIKIDIEGHEPVAFKGMEKCLQQHNPVLLIEFSHSCLKRAGFEPSEFARELMQRFNYRFARQVHEKLIWVESTEPEDGYYFLIHAGQADRYLPLFQS